MQVKANCKNIETLQKGPLNRKKKGSRLIWPVFKDAFPYALDMWCWLLRWVFDKELGRMSDEIAVSLGQNFLEDLKKTAKNLIGDGRSQRRKKQ